MMYYLCAECNFSPFSGPYVYDGASFLPILLRARCRVQALEATPALTHPTSCALVANHSVAMGAAASKIPQKMTEEEFMAAAAETYAALKGELGASLCQVLL